jgi:hypothetical protein
LLRANYSAIADRIVPALISAECTSIVDHCAAVQRGEHPTIFVESIVGEEMLAAGAFLMVLAEALIHTPPEGVSANGRPGEYYNAIVKSLCECCEVTLSCITTPFSPTDDMQHFVDPRCTIMEAWYLCMDELAKASLIFRNAGLDTQTMDWMLSQSLALSVLLVRRKHITRKGPETADLSLQGLSLDGPQTLAMLNFMESALKLGPGILVNSMEPLRFAILVDESTITSVLGQEDEYGGALLCASFFRAMSGAVPPWAIECMPGLFASLFRGACQNDASKFLRMLRQSFTVRTMVSTEQQGGANADGNSISTHLAGPFVATITSGATVEFVANAQQAAEKNTMDGWKKFKTGVKKICGGKKKDTFSLKPGFTSWDCDRL